MCFASAPASMVMQRVEHSTALIGEPIAGFHCDHSPNGWARAIIKELPSCNLSAPGDLPTGPRGEHGQHPGPDQRGAQPLLGRQHADHPPGEPSRRRGEGLVSGGVLPPGFDRSRLGRDRDPARDQAARGGPGRPSNSPPQRPGGWGDRRARHPSRPRRGRLPPDRHQPDGPGLAGPLGPALRARRRVHRGQADAKLGGVPAEMLHLR